MTDLVLEHTRDGVVTLTLNRPELRNPISDIEMVDALVGAIKRADADIATRVIILTGAGTAFSSGGNVANMAKGRGLAATLPAQTRRNYRHGIQRIPLAFDGLEVPVVAAINGAAIGAGLDLACMCDIRIAARSAKFAESFVKLGLVPGDGGAWLLPRMIGNARAAELALTGDVFGAEEALAYGLVSRVVPDEELLAVAGEIAGRIAANPPHAVRMTRRLLKSGSGATLPALLEMSAAFQALAHETADHDEAVRAFTEKRKPDFRGE